MEDSNGSNKSQPVSDHEHEFDHDARKKKKKRKKSKKKKKRKDRDKDDENINKGDNEELDDEEAKRKKKKRKKKRKKRKKRKHKNAVQKEEFEYEPDFVAEKEGKPANFRPPHKVMGVSPEDLADQVAADKEDPKSSCDLQSTVKCFKTICFYFELIYIIYIYIYNKYKFF